MIEIPAAVANRGGVILHLVFGKFVAGRYTLVEILIFAELLIVRSEGNSRFKYIPGVGHN